MYNVSSSPSIKRVTNDSDSDTEAIEKGRGLCAGNNKEQHDVHIISDLWKSGFILGFICGTLTTGSIITFMRVFTHG